MNEETAKIVQKIHGAFEGYLNDGTFSLNIEELELKIHLKGPKWEGVVDRPVADFLVALDNRLRKELEILGVELPDTDHGIVALRIEKGSLMAFLQYAPEVLHQVQLLAPGHKAAFVASILTAMNVFGNVRKRINEEVPQETEKVRSGDRAFFLQHVADLETREREVQKPLKALVSHMDPAKDTVSLPGQEELVNQKAAKKVLASSQAPEKPKPRNYYIDGPYTVEGIDTKTSKWKISLRYGAEVRFKAQVNLEQSEMQKLLDAFKEANKKGTKIAPDLHVSAEIAAKGIKSAIVVGVGEPRPSSVKLSNAFADAKKHAAR